MTFTKTRLALLFVVSLTVTGIIGYVIGSDVSLFDRSSVEDITFVEFVPFDAFKMLENNDLAETSYREDFETAGGANGMSQDTPYIRAINAYQMTLEGYRDELVNAQIEDLSPDAEEYRQRVLTSVATTLTYLKALEQHGIYGDGLYGNPMPLPPSDAHAAERVELIVLAEQFPCSCNASK